MNSFLLQDVTANIAQRGIAILALILYSQSLPLITIDHGILFELHGCQLVIAM